MTMALSLLVSYYSAIPVEARDASLLFNQTVEVYRLLCETFSIANTKYRSRQPTADGDENAASDINGSFLRCCEVQLYHDQVLKLYHDQVFKMNKSLDSHTTEYFRTMKDQVACKDAFRQW
jgi:hypothetical protein